jgi:ABC-type Mn2+/Zn2+ transport system permease subunit
LRLAAFAIALVVIMAFEAFGWAQRRFSLMVVAVVGGLTGLVMGVFLSLAAGANGPVTAIMTVFFTFGLAAVATLFAWANRKAIP